MSTLRVLHETHTRLRVALPAAADPATLAARIAGVAGVRTVRANQRLGCVAIEHDGDPASRRAAWEALLAACGGMHASPTPAPRERARPRPARVSAADRASGGAGRTLAAGIAIAVRTLRTAGAGWGPSALALAVPLLPPTWRAGGAVALVTGRALSRPGRLAAEPAAVLLDAASLVALAVDGHPRVVAASVLMREVAERSAGRMVRQADALLDRLLPIEAPVYPTRRGVARRFAPRPPADLVPGDRLRLQAGDVVPVDGWVLSGQATVQSPAHDEAPRERAVARGDHVPAGERLCLGRLELHVEAALDASRLARMRAHVRHVADADAPAARRLPGLERMIALPVTGAALVLGLTGDTARSAAMLQADPTQGLDLALPVAREAARVAIARRGLLSGSLEAIERLATARVLVLQDAGVLCSGRWRIESIRSEPAGHEDAVRAWLAALAGWPGELPGGACLSDRQVRGWVREGGLLSLPEGDAVLVDEARLPARVPDRMLPRSGGPDPTADGDPEEPPALRRRLAFVASGRCVARIVVASPVRADLRVRLAELAELGFERIALMPEARDTLPARAVPGVHRVTAPGAARAAWLADAGRGGEPVVLVHTVLRDLLPPGGLGLCPVDADAGAHGVLLGDPLASLVSARRVAIDVHRRLQRHQTGAMAVNALLMTASALRWAPPLATTIGHHGFAALLLLDSLRIERDASRASSTPTPGANG